MKKRQYSRWLVLGIFLLAACMRSPFTSLPSVIDQIADSFHQPATNLGILTTIPLIRFGLCSTIVPSISRRWGNEVTLGVALLIMVIGSFLRIFNFVTLIFSTILVGIAITFLNVLLPAVITEKIPQKIGLLTGMYNVSLAIFSAIGAYVITPVTQATNWQTAIIGFTLLIGVTFIVWFPNLRFNHRHLVPIQAGNQTRIWTNPRAWLLLMYFGLQSFAFYIIVAWLPSIAMAAGLSNATASLVASSFQLLSLPAAFLIPTITPRFKNRVPLVIMAATPLLIGLILLLWPLNSLAYFIFISFLLGTGTSATFGIVITLFGLKTHSPEETSRLSGMVQSVGYILAALGPVIAGNIKAATGNWQASLWMTIIIVVIMIAFGALSERHQYIN